jgi:uncharacterized membrane protein
MTQYVRTFAEWSAAAVEIVGIGVLLGVVFFTCVRGVLAASGSSGGGRDAVLSMRTTLARGILLGLEFLVAADIIHTVAVEFTLDNVVVLAIIVLIRTFLSFAIEVELNGRWPWQGARGEDRSG